MRTRATRRIAVVAAVVVVPLLAGAGPALALKPDDGEPHGPSLGIGNTLLLFVVIPLAAFLVIAALSVLPSALSRPRYRPGKPWDHEPTWVGEPPAGASTAAASARGGASAEW